MVETESQIQNLISFLSIGGMRLPVSFLHALPTQIKVEYVPQIKFPVQE